MPGPILDTNVILRHLLQDHEDHSPRASAFMERLAEGQERVELPVTALFEVIFSLQSQYKRSVDEIYEHVRPIVTWRSIAISNRNRVLRAFEIYREFRLGFADSYHAAMAEQTATKQIISFDRGYDRLRTLRRLEP